VAAAQDQPAATTKAQRERPAYSAPSRPTAVVVADRQTTQQALLADQAAADRLTDSEEPQRQVKAIPAERAVTQPTHTAEVAAVVLQLTAQMAHQQSAVTVATAQLHPLPAARLLEHQVVAADLHLDQEPKEQAATAAAALAVSTRQAPTATVHREQQIPAAVAAVAVNPSARTPKTVRQADQELS